jgi:hypothetical protein
MRLPISLNEYVWGGGEGEGVEGEEFGDLGEGFAFGVEIALELLKLAVEFGHIAALR